MFNVKDLVDVPGRELTNYGRIRELRSGGRALVRFREPRQPKRGDCCDSCHFPGMLSQEVGTGEISCMRSGCGYQHGFDERNEMIALDLLVNITTKRRDEKKAEFRKRLAVLLQEGIKEGFVTAETEQILKTI